MREATLKAGARQVSVIEEPMAAAIGAGLPISEPTGSMIVDIGGGTAEIAVISLGGIVASRSVRMAGDMFDQAIIAFIKRKYNLLIGERTAEQIKIEIGSAYPMDPEMTMEIKGRNLVDGLPKNIVVHSEDVREALLECLVKITSAIKETLERTPPELSADIIDHGITLTGGGALLRGLDQLIQSETGIDVHVAEDPLDCVAMGAGAVLDHLLGRCAGRRFVACEKQRGRGCCVSGGGARHVLRRGGCSAARVFWRTFAIGERSPLKDFFDTWKFKILVAIAVFLAAIMA